VLNGASFFHTSGITFALSESAADSALEAICVAKELGLRVSIDLNYRARLWSQQQAQSVMSTAVDLANVLITTEEDAERVFQIRGKGYDAVAKELAERFGLDAVAITLRETPSVWRNTWSAIAFDRAAGEIRSAPTFSIEVVDRVGSGDAFSGGFLYGLLTGGVQAGLNYGVGISALKQTHPGDLAWATRPEVDQVLEGGSLRIAR
jgi:2-dehydro-3-deoxygluconokinase